MAMMSIPVFPNSYGGFTQGTKKCVIWLITNKDDDSTARRKSESEKEDKDGDRYSVDEDRIIQ